MEDLIKILFWLVDIDIGITAEWGFGQMKLGFINIDVQLLNYQCIERVF